MNTNRLNRLWTGLCTFGMIAAPLLQSVAMAARPRGVSEAWAVANPGANLLYGLLELIAGLLYIPAFIGLARLIGQRRWLLGFIGSIFGVIGAFGFTMLNTLILVSHGFATTGGAQGLELVKTLQQSAVAGVALLLFLPGMMLGMLLLTIGVFREFKGLRVPAGIVFAFLLADLAAPPQILHLDLPHIILTVGLAWIGVVGPRLVAQSAPENAIL